jgi:alpha-tubulin suppressor-like RCC1 family protein
MDATSVDAAVDGATDDASAAAIAMLGAPCSVALDKACTGHNAADKLVCLDGKWAHNGSCDTDARCETERGPSQGLCVSIASGCAGKMPGATVCDGMTVKTCGPDLTDLKTTTTCGANAHCEEGSPAGCKCDTGYAGGDAGAACVNANDCASNPCGSGNTCTDALNDYSCTCGSNAWSKDTKTCVSRFDRVSAGGNRTCALRKDRTVACWGEDMDGDSSLPQPIAGLTNVTQISVGVNHACALRDNGNVSCWGHNDHGQLGNGNTSDSLRTPVTVSNLNNVLQVSAGDGFTCAVVDGLFNPSVQCWGDNSVGQLGINNQQSNAPRPMAVNGNFNLVSAGSGHACARRSNNGSLACWGRNTQGQLGTGSTAERVNAPASIAGSLGNNVNEVVAGAGFTCARKSGSVYCWGAPIGATGDNLLAPPTTGIANLSDAAQLSAGAAGASVCVRKTGNTVVCWGSDADGQLGNGEDPASATPVAISGDLTNVKEVASGSKHACLVKSNDGEIHCWGKGSSGELGNGARTDSPSPVMVVH